MKKQDLFQAMNGIEESILQETQVKRKQGQRRRRQKRLLCALAALILAGTGVTAASLNRHAIPVSPTESVSSASSSPAEPESSASPSPTASPGKGVTLPLAEPPANIDPATASFACPFFWVDGRQYASFVSVPYSESLIGKRLGYVEMLVYDVGEFLPPSEQEALSYQMALGCVEGDFYEIPGYDPEFLLGMREEHVDGEKLLFFFSGSGQTFYTGEDLFQDLLSAKGRVSGVRAEIEKETEYEIQRFSVPIEEDFTPFLEALCSAPAVPDEETPGGVRLGELSVQLEDGVEFRLVLCPGGYVKFAGIYGVAFQIDSELFNTWAGYCQ